MGAFRRCSPTLGVFYGIRREGGNGCAHITDPLAGAGTRWIDVVDLVDEERE